MATGRAYWKGYLKLSLVTCPIALFPASSQAEKTNFHQSIVRRATVYASKWWTK
jgi:non-homologous end joining protein Ku